MTAKKFEEMFPSLANAEAFTVGGRRFVSIDKVLEIIENEPYRGSALNMKRAIIDDILALKGGD